MPQFTYRGRDKTGTLRTGERFANNVDELNGELSREGIFPTDIKERVQRESYLDQIKSMLQSETLHLSEMSVFARQMKILNQSGVPIVVALRQLAGYSRSNKLSMALKGTADSLEKGKSLSASMANYPQVFSPLVINIIHIGENTGHLTEAFSHLYDYLSFESNNRKLLKSTFRYPVFVMISIILAIIILNIFVIPTFARFYVNIEVALPWQTRFLIGMSNIVTHYGILILIGTMLITYSIYKYIHTPTGKYKFDHLLFRMPIFGKIYRRLVLIRFAQSLAIILNSGVPISQGLSLVKNSLNNKYIEDQISSAQELIERGNSFTQAMAKIELFSPLENQIIAVGEKNGELGQAMNYIGTFQSSEIEFDLKRVSDSIGPILITIIAGMVLIVALGIYLPVWNMINLVH